MKGAVYETDHLHRYADPGKSAGKLLFAVDSERISPCFGREGKGIPRSLCWSLGVVGDLSSATSLEPFPPVSAGTFGRHGAGLFFPRLPQNVL